jgi:hypothetical protein
MSINFFKIKECLLLLCLACVTDWTRRSVRPFKIGLNGYFKAGLRRNGSMINAFD